MLLAAVFVQVDQFEHLTKIDIEQLGKSLHERRVVRRENACVIACFVPIIEWIYWWRPKVLLCT